METSGARPPETKIPVKKFTDESQPNAKSDAEIHLRILATSDLHMHLMPFNYYSGISTDKLGLVRTASLITQARAEATNCLLFDNGDFLQGSPLATYLAQPGQAHPAAIHPIFAAMNHLRYDACTLGNHEFNFGLDFLENALSGANFPIVSANVLKLVGAAQATPLVPAYVILDRVVVDTLGAKHSIRIGVIGFTPPQIMIWDHWHLAGKLTTCDIVDAAVAYVPQMQSEGADLIIALSHSGIGQSENVPGLENASTALAQVAGIDAVITGHSHLVFPSQDFAATRDVDPDLGSLCGKPAVMPGFNGSHLGVIDLVLSRSSGAYRIRRQNVEARPIWHHDAQGCGSASVQSDPALVRILSDVHLETLDWVEKPIGYTSVSLHSFFALVADAPALQLVAAAQIQHVERQLADTPYSALPVLASVAPFKAGGRGGPENYTDVPAGYVKLRHAADLYIHPNTSAAIRLTGAQIANWLENAVGIFNQIKPGSVDTPLINDSFPSFNFEMLFGLRFQIDLGMPPRFDVVGTLINPQSQRIVGLQYDDALIDPSASFAIATNSYRVGTDTAYLPCAKDQMLFRSTEINLDLVQSYFATNRVNRPFDGPNRRFVSMPGTSVTFDTSPKAVTYLAELPNLNIEPMHLTPTGFLRFRLHL